MANETAERTAGLRAGDHARGLRLRPGSNARGAAPERGRTCLEQMPSGQAGPVRI